MPLIELGAWLENDVLIGTKVTDPSGGIIQSPCDRNRPGRSGWAEAICAVPAVPVTVPVKTAKSGY